MESVEILGSQNPNNARWQPYEGQEIDSLIKHKKFPEEVGEKIVQETFRIMEMCGDPNTPTNEDTGLVIGYVQSGKTLSFTSLTALANDNQYQLIIIIAGTSVPLSDQSYERVKKDLRIDNRYDRKWVIIKNPKTQEDRDTIKMKLEEWSDSTLPKEECSTLLITVMKNGNHLLNFTNALRGINLAGVPTLIIDDEGDQASLNTKARANSNSGQAVNEGEASTIYRRITTLRSLFPHHTFLQYTATPQGNLFVNIMDRLSPNFIKLLEPGDDYTGGNTFFVQQPELVRTIPSAQIPSANNHLTDPPDSLLYALKIFFLGVVAGNIKRDQHNRSMMVHPSRLTGSQNAFYRWVKDICEGWKLLLRSNDVDEKQVLLHEFEVAYQDLVRTVGPELPDFSELSGNRLIQAINYTKIVEINASRGKTPAIRWSDNYSYVLVGGQAMDRGFTVEGLTVSYMPRSLGTGQVDTTLQRARFFGYKRSYLGFCRIWLDQPTIDAFRAIIDHEEDVRSRLVEYASSNRHLNEWDREAVLSQVLNLTRPNILYNDLDRDYFGAEWFIIRAPHDSDNRIPENSAVVDSFLGTHAGSFEEDAGHAQRTDEQKHLMATIPLSECLIGLLNKLKFTRESDSQTFSSLRSVIGRYLQENTQEQCELYAIRASKKNGGTINQEVRERRLDDNDSIQQLFQGKNLKSGAIIYPGDRELKDVDAVTVQIHHLHLKDANGNEILDEEGNSKYTRVPTIAIWIPGRIGKDIIRQPDNIT